MKWKGRKESDNVEYRGSGGSGGFPGLGGGGGIGKFGLGGIVLVLVLSLLFGQNPLDLIMNSGMLGGGTPTEHTEYVPKSEAEKEWGSFLSVVLADSEDVWTEVFKSYGRTYVKPKLVIYQDAVASGCGQASSQMGPFYCGQDQTVYIDVSFANDLKSKFAASGDFPFAYVLCHEIGHHVQLQTGVLNKVQGLRGQVSDLQYNNEMVKLELQADYYAGVVAHYLQQKGYLDPGDVEEGMAAAAGVGDDRIMEMAGRNANPDNFQHGSSEQRQRWFLRGYKYGDLEHGNTFDTADSRDL